MWASAAKPAWVFLIFFCMVRIWQQVPFGCPLKYQPKGGFSETHVEKLPVSNLSVCHSLTCIFNEDFGSLAQISFGGMLPHVSFKPTCKEQPQRNIQPYCLQRHWNEAADGPWFAKWEKNKKQKKRGGSFSTVPGVPSPFCPGIQIFPANLRKPGKNGSGF